MSVFLLPHAHLNVLAHEVTRWGVHLLRRDNALSEALAGMGVDMRVGYPGATSEKLLAQSVGEVLVQAMADSYTARYTLEEDEAARVGQYVDSYRFERPRGTYTVAEVAQAVRSFNYQACEAPGWEQSAGFVFYTLMQEHLLGRLVAESEADTWVIREDSTRP